MCVCVCNNYDIMTAHNLIIKQQENILVCMCVSWCVRILTSTNDIDRGDCIYINVMGMYEEETVRWHEH